MIEPRSETRRASDGYPIHVTLWPGSGTPRGQVVVLHGVQSHGGWYHNLGRTLANAGYATSFPDRRGSGSNPDDRGHASSALRLLADVADDLRTIKEQHPTLPIAVVGISWGGKLAVVTAARRPDLVDALALICPGMLPRVDVSRTERVRIAWAWCTNRRKTFPVPLSDPALFTANPAGQAFIANDPLGLRTATAGLLAASTFLDLRVARAPARVHQPALLMLGGQDRIIDNSKTLVFFEKLASTDRQVIEYPEGHHTLEFDNDPSQYARDLIGWLDQRLGANLATAERVGS